jgi:hypothetical protein
MRVSMGEFFEGLDFWRALKMHLRRRVGIQESGHDFSQKRHVTEMNDDGEC